jgi:hypothetical protein
MLILLAVAGCWRGDVRETTPGPSADDKPLATAQPGAPCAEVASHVRDVMAASNEGPVARRAEQYRELIERRCNTDGWSMELKRCLVGAPTLDDTNGCEQLATPDQQKALEHDVELMLNAN